MMSRNLAVTREDLKQKCCTGCGMNGDCILQLMFEDKFKRKRKKLDCPHRTKGEK